MIAGTSGKPGIAGRCGSAALIVGASVVVSCAGGGRAPTTRMDVRDYQAMTSALGAELSRAQPIAGRGPDMPTMTIAMDRVENLTTDIITEGEGWFLMDRVREAQDIVALSRERSVRFVIPAARTDAIRGIAPEALGERAPTHALRATIRSATRQAGDDRTEVYDIEYRLVEIESGEAVWTGTFPFKRAAAGRAWD
jgi:hypothetical protein